MNTHVEKTPQTPSRKLSDREKSNLAGEFQSAGTTAEMMKLFSEMEGVFDEEELGFPSLKIALKLDLEGEDPEKILPFARRALKAFDSSSDEYISLPLVMTLQLLGSVDFRLKKFGDSLGLLNRANRMLGRLQDEGFLSADVLNPVFYAVHIKLVKVKNAMGRREEALENIRGCLEIVEAISGEGSVEAGKANHILAEAYIEVLKFKEAMPYCLKALEIREKALGRNALEVAYDRRLLGVIYSALDDHEQALEQIVLAKRILKDLNLNDGLLRYDIDAAIMMLRMGRYDDTIVTLRNVLHQTDEDSMPRVLMLETMADALRHQEKFAECKSCLETCVGILDRSERISPVEVALAYSEISKQYETMNELETEISLLKKALALTEKLPREQHLEGSVCARLGLSLMRTGKVQLAIPYLESAAEKLKDSSSPMHIGVGGVGRLHYNLGTAYLEVGRSQSAAQMFAVAKDIYKAALGPHHEDTIDACQKISEAYGEMGSYVTAIEFQQQVIEAWESHGASAIVELREARRFLEQLKRKAHGASANKSHT